MTTLFNWFIQADRLFFKTEQNAVQELLFAPVGKCDKRVQLSDNAVGELNNVVEELNTLVGELNTLVEELNTLVGELNTLVEELNSLVEAFLAFFVGVLGCRLVSAPT